MDEDEFKEAVFRKQMKDSFNRFKHLSVEELLKEIEHYESEIRRANMRLHALHTTALLKQLEKDKK